LRRQLQHVERGLRAFRLKPLVDRNELSPQLIIQIAFPGPLAGLVSVLGMLAAFSWIVWRFGPALLRIAGFCSLWVAWACGSQGGYGYCAALSVLGAVLWVAGTVWYAKRRGRWPSPLSERLLPRVLGRRSPLAPAEPQGDRVVVPLRRS